MSKRILLTAFRGSSAELLIRAWKDYSKIILPNDKLKDSEMLVNATKREAFDYIISFGQKPNIKDKVYIETTGRQGEACLETDFPWSKLKVLLEENGLGVRISHNAGTSFCNQLYYNGLKYLQDNKAPMKIIFIHIPFEKNISDVAQLQMQIGKALKQLE